MHHNSKIEQLRRYQGLMVSDMLLDGHPPIVRVEFLLILIGQELHYLASHMLRFSQGMFIYRIASIIGVPT